MNILLLSLGGGGGNILRSVKALFRRDLMISQKTDAGYSERLDQRVATRFLDTNQFSLVDVPHEERVLIGAKTTGHLGSRHDPEVAQRALDESRRDVEELLRPYAAVIVIATGGKGTGAGTIVPVTLMARQQKKLVIPIFVRPSFERHEVEKRRFDHALAISQQLDAAKIRFIEILNDRGYLDADPQPQAVVWERMNVPIARALRGLLYVLGDLSQIDPSDLSSLFAGQGRLRVGFSEIDSAAGSEPSDQEVEEAVQRCWDNPYCSFNGPAGTSLVYIQGQWSNVVDAKIKGRLAVRASGTESSPYNPLYARASQTPKPWGVTALFAEFTGHHAPIDIIWQRETDVSLAADSSAIDFVAADTVANDVGRWEHPVEPPAAVKEQRPGRPASFATFWELALALNRSDPAALALAQDGDECHLTVDGTELRKLLGTLWFRSVFPRLSPTWQARLLNVLVESVVVPNHVLRMGRQEMHLSEVSYAQLTELFSRASVTDGVRADLRLLMTVGSLWGQESLRRFRFSDSPQGAESSKLAVLLQGLRL